MGSEYATQRFPPLNKLQLLKKHIIKAKYNFLENLYVL